MKRTKTLAQLALAVAGLLLGSWSRAAIPEVRGSKIGAGPRTFELTARADYLSTADGSSMALWGYADTGADPLARAQYPGPTLVVDQGEVVEVTLVNELDEPSSIVFPGQGEVTATGGVPHPITSAIREAAALGGSVTYSFTAAHPGTFQYYSGSRMEVQIEMGLAGVLIVRPAGYDPADRGTWTAYGDAGSAYDREYLFVLSEADPEIHDMVDFGQQPDNPMYKPVYWFINGRNLPDTLEGHFVNWLPTQPYSSLAQMHPGERVLMRVVTLSRHQHPLHPHGNHQRVIARDGRRLLTTDGLGNDVDLSIGQFTFHANPGETLDAIFEWTGTELGWDIYGDPADPMYAHSCTGETDPALCGTNNCYDPGTYEYCPDHGKPFPVVLPELQNMAFGAFYSGSPYMGGAGDLPPGEGGNNPNSAFTYAWHSHTEMELANFDIFPGGMFTLMFIEHPGVTIGNDCPDTDADALADCVPGCLPAPGDACGETCIDVDGDGYGAGGVAANTCLGADCDDADPAVNPGAVELCGTGVDEDCDGSIDEPGCV